MFWHQRRQSFVKSKTARYIKLQRINIIVPCFFVSYASFTVFSFWFERNFEALQHFEETSFKPAILILQGRRNDLCTVYKIHNTDPSLTKSLFFLEELNNEITKMKDKLEKLWRYWWGSIEIPVLSNFFLGLNITEF